MWKSIVRSVQFNCFVVVSSCVECGESAYNKIEMIDMRHALIVKCQPSASVLSSSHIIQLIRPLTVCNRLIMRMRVRYEHSFPISPYSFRIFRQWLKSSSPAQPLSNGHAHLCHCVFCEAIKIMSSMIIFVSFVFVCFWSLAVIIFNR